MPGSQETEPMEALLLRERKDCANEGPHWVYASPSMTSEQREQCWQSFMLTHSLFLKQLYLLCDLSFRFRREIHKRLTFVT